jgi:hypothetical protein
MNKTRSLIPPLVYRVQEAVIAMTKELGVGTNLRLHDGLMTLMSGRLLESRGALIPALDAMGLSKNECLRTREGIQSGSWTIKGLLEGLQHWVRQCTKWQGLQVGAYSVKAIDTTCIFRPRLQGCETKHYHSSADKALPAITFGVLSALGSIEAQKVSLPLLLVRGDQQALSEEALMRELCEQGLAYLGEQDVVTADRKFPVMVMLEAGMKKVVVRRASNFTVRRVLKPEKCEAMKAARGRPRKHGELIRPLARTYKGKVHAASESDETHTWTDHQGHPLVANLWRNVVLPEQAHWSKERKVLNQQQAWLVLVVKHPKYPLPMVILLNVALSPEHAYTIMRRRWGIEQMPLVAKQLLGGHRMFVFENEMRFRLPELIFVAASILMVVAGNSETMPSGWWDTKPKPTAGRLRRELSKVRDLRLLNLPTQLRKKNSYTSHLTFGFHSGIKKGRKVSET